MSDMPAISVCICSFRRPHLALTLASVAKLDLPRDLRIEVIVADNDDTPSAAAQVAALAATYPHALRYLHAPARNISVARNACLDAATSPLIAFIDDDELATPQWLAALLAEQQKSAADIVLGPVESRYPPQAPRWLRAGDFHSIRPVRVKGRIVTGYTSNVLFRREAAVLLNLRFDESLGRSGGEDTAFFTRLHRSGSLIAYAPDAVVTEDVAAERLNFRWLAERAFRSGQTHGMLLLTDRPGGAARLSRTGLAAAKTCFCLAAAAAALLTGRARRWLLRGILHAGVAARLLGLKELTPYG